MFYNGLGYDTVADGQFCANGPRQGYPKSSWRVWVASKSASLQFSRINFVLLKSKKSCF